MRAKKHLITLFIATLTVVFFTRLLLKNNNEKKSFTRERPADFFNLEQNGPKSYIGSKAIQTKDIGSDEDLETEEIFISIRDLEEASESGFQKTYKLLAEVSLNNKSQKFKITLGEALDEVYSIVFVGGEGDGESEIKGLLLNETQSKALSESLEDNYFANDWKKFDQIDNKFKSLSFSGRSLDIESSIKVYVQYQGEEE